MSTPIRPAAPESGHLSLVPGRDPDPEVGALLDFAPVPRKRDVDGGWTPELQREFIARLAVHGSATKTCDEMGKNQTGIMKLYRSPAGASFRAAWDGAVELAKRRRTEQAALDHVAPGTRPPTIDHRRKLPACTAGPLPGQIMNERGEWENEASVAGRLEEAKENICRKLLGARRLFLSEIAGCPAKRAAFEILTELPVDWDKATRLEAQADEPWHPARLRKPDMVLTAESGWLMGEAGYGPDKKAALLSDLNAYRAEQGLEPVDFAEEEPEDIGGAEWSAQPPEDAGPRLRGL